MDTKDIKGLSINEKAKLFVGKNKWELEPINNRSILLSDGPHGIRKEYIANGRVEAVKAISYPSASLSACSFNTSLLNEMGSMLAKECIKNKIDILLGPSVNIKRNPLCGRSFEYFSEDPYLAGKLASAYIRGAQREGVGTSLKHFACNSQEEARFINDSIVDERALREIYLKPFEIAIREAKPWSIMVSYNKVNNVRSCNNKYLLTDICRNELGFDGVFLSDWGAIDNPSLSLEAGLDLEMPGTSKGSSEKILSDIDSGRLDIKYLNLSNKRIIDLYHKAEREKINDFDYNKGLDLALRINEEGIVLLKNENNILPLKKTESVALIGGFMDEPRYQGGGSSAINPIYISTLYNELMSMNIRLAYAKGYNEDDIIPNKRLIEAAVMASRGRDKVIIMIGLPRIIESEGYDREDMKIPEAHLALVNEIYKVNKNIIVILQNGAPVEMPFIDKCQGLIEAYLGGSMHAVALKNILYGFTNPSGRLAESFPLKYSDVCSHYDYLKNPYYSLYKESIYVGYRYYNTFNIPVLFPFGYGLSYSEVAYSDFSVKRSNDKLIFKFKLHNLSDIRALEAVQVYSSKLDSKIMRARKELRCFNKLTLEPHEELYSSLVMDINDLKYYDRIDKKYKLEGGMYRFYLAKNVNDDSLYFDLEIKSNDSITRAVDVIDNPIYLAMNREISDEEFFKLCGRSYTLEHKIRPYTTDSPIKDLYRNPLGFLILKPLAFLVAHSIKNKYDRKMYKMSIPYQPVRSIAMLSNMTKRQIDGIVDIFNWHIIRGLKKLCSKRRY